MKNILYFFYNEIDEYTSLLLHDVLIEVLNTSGINLKVYSNYTNHKSLENLISGEEVTNTKWDLLLVHNSFCFIHYEKVFDRLKSIPVLFLSDCKGIQGKIKITKNVRHILYTKDSYYGQFKNLASSLYTETTLPVILNGGRSKKQERDRKNILLYPTTYNFDTCLNLTEYYFSHGRYNIYLVSDLLQHFFDRHPKPFITIVSREEAKRKMKNADLVIGDGYNIISSLALGIPCVIVGDYGFGGRVSLDNYKLQKENNFKGRLGGYRDEYIPSDLFFYQIRNILTKTINEEEIAQLKKVVKKDFPFDRFKKLVNCQIDKIIAIDKVLKKRSQFESLKPDLIRNFTTRNIDGQFYIIINGDEAFEMEESLFNIIVGQCNGLTTISEIAALNKMDKEELSIFYSNLRFLWNNGYIMFI